MDEPTQICARVKVSGLVQGVGYRFSTWQRAHQTGITGWVRNLTDGRVEALFEGLPAQVESMVQWCQHGPPAAKVSHVEVDFEPLQHCIGFEILYE